MRGERTQAADVMMFPNLTALSKSDAAESWHRFIR
jgi:hypothetical protein